MPECLPVLPDLIFLCSHCIQYIFFHAYSPGNYRCKLHSSQFPCVTKLIVLFHKKSKLMSLNPLSKNFFSLHTEDNDICQQQYKEGNAPNDQDIWSLSDSSDDE